jgi:hypothetical protein
VFDDWDLEPKSKLQKRLAEYQELVEKLKCLQQDKALRDVGINTKEDRS